MSSYWSLFSFLLRHDLPRVSELMRDADSVAKVLAVRRVVLKVGDTISPVVSVPDPNQPQRGLVWHQTLPFDN